jgi:2-C-methyl-D-erythritol 4-phosphate cytidylyltransferase/2-C-methyl-D-erythritol 2,4-cyclodiphosphate synthase
VSGVWAVLVAAGRGERFGADRPKAFAGLAGRPLLAESLERLDGSPWIDAIVLVAPPGWEEPAILLAEEIGAGKVVAAVTGGTRSRAESVRIGVAEVAEDAAVILVHDAARPLVTDAVIERVLGALGESWDGAVPGLPVVDTLKRAGADGGVIETVDRTGLFAVQTPQAFVASAFRRALALVPDDTTDCAGAVERAGGRVRVVEGDPGLVKVTSPADLEALENLHSPPS